MPIRIDNSTVSDRAWGDVDKATLARRLAENAAAQEEAERKALEEQERYKDNMPGPCAHVGCLNTAVSETPCQSLLRHENREREERFALLWNVDP